MRSDIKVGITIAVILMVAGVVWYVVSREPSETPTKTTPDESGITKAQDEKDRKNVVDTKLPLVRSIYETTDPATQPPADEKPAETTPETPSTPPDTVITRTDTDTGAYEEWPSVPPSRLTTPVLTTPETDSTTPAPAGQARTYVVKDGDSYWLIARNEWGNGRLHPHLEKANPKIPPRSLRPGMTIKIPPRPDAASATTPPSTVVGKKYGQTGVDTATGKRFYIVKKGDNGFWGVSLAVYGEGKHFQLIEAANPKLKSNELQPGQKVWYPEKPKSKPEPVVDRTTTPFTPLAAGVTGAPSKTVLPDGRVFD